MVCGYCPQKKKVVWVLLDWQIQTSLCFVNGFGVFAPSTMLHGKGRFRLNTTNPLSVKSFQLGNIAYELTLRSITKGLSWFAAHVDWKVSNGNIYYSEEPSVHMCAKIMCSHKSQMELLKKPGIRTLLIGMSSLEDPYVTEK